MDSEPKVEIRDFSDGALCALTQLTPNVVHLWWRSLEEPVTSIQACYGLLSLDEQERASRFRADHARNNFILTRSALRSLLAAHLQKSPQELSFGLTKYGKPFLYGTPDVRFNVSHADGLALLGFTRGREVGVDVERIQSQLDTWKLAERFFSARERGALMELHGQELQSAFFRCWSRKEAYIKARGEGLSLPLSQFDVSIAPNESHALLATRPDATEADRWVVRDVATLPAYAAACAFSRMATNKTPVES
jgi:4'-phosphopantetheinyl transferase